MRVRPGDDSGQFGGDGLPQVDDRGYNAPASVPRPFTGGASCESRTNTSNTSAFEVSSKRRKGFPSETHVKRGDRVVGGSKELVEKLGRNDPCPCGSGRRFQALLHVERRVRRIGPGLLLSGRLEPDGRGYAEVVSAWRSARDADQAAAPKYPQGEN